MTGGERWEKVKELLDRVLDLPPGEHESFLRKATAGDPELFDEVWALAGAAEPDLDALEHPAALHVAALEGDAGELANLEGTTLGPYRLTRLLGRGGMGVVYEAERTGEVSGTVAVKLIKHGMDSALVSRRFRQERQILARLTHPNIAHFIDGGVSRAGRPYFVLERVEGTPITEYCVAHQMSVEGRVRLFLQVLDAVGFAHWHLVVHRDLKPTNILVRDDGLVKLLDFGVAKVLGEDPGTDATLTRLGGRVLTPSYSSPEQIRGEPVSTAADIYSLGVVLYELLTGRPPFLLDTAPIAEVQRVVSFEEPTKPSEAGRPLSRDLDAILLKALRKEPQRRYASAMEFHDDLCRFLDHRPVLARRGSLAYRLGRFAKRNRTAVVATVTMLAALGVGGGYGLRQAAEARRQAALAELRVADVRALVNSLVFEVHDAVAALPGSTGARNLILARAYERLDDVTASLPRDPDLLVDLAESYRRLGEVQGRPMGPSLGDLSAARRSFEQGLDLARRAVGQDSSHYGRLRSLGLLHERLAATLAFSGDVAAGVAHSREAQAIYERIARAFPDSVRHQLTAVIGQINLSDMQGHPSFPNLGQPDSAEAGYRAALVRLDRPPLDGDTSYGVRRYRGLLEERLASMLRLRGEFSESLARYQGALTAREALFRDFPTDDEAWRDVGVTRQNLCGVAQALGRLAEAEADCESALQIYRDRFQADSLNAQTLSDLGSVHDSFQELYRVTGDTVRALGHLDLMREWAERRLDRDPMALQGRQMRLDALLTRGLILAARDAPVPEVDELLRLVDELAAEGHLSTEDADRAATFRRLTGG